ncbi:MAG TPA: hypothetical protein VG322_09135 [Candidatus Acidoferrales bacterium]|jgi:hypothetical protein|nr:hypothetical protein [Candidatus Acidoferrales bacterium]
MPYLISIWLAGVFALSLAPYEVKNHFGTKGALHDAGHVVIFFITAVLLCWNAEGVGRKLFRCLLAFCVVFAAEGLEKLVYHDRFEWNDVAMDVGGVLVGFAVVMLAGMISASLKYRSRTPRSS